MSIMKRNQRPLICGIFLHDKAIGALWEALSDQKVHCLSKVLSKLANAFRITKPENRLYWIKRGGEEKKHRKRGQLYIWSIIIDWDADTVQMTNLRSI
jgi:hypothetical protein